MILVIVESPAKAKTISKFLGRDYRVVASYGHIRDLPSSADEIPEEIKGKPWARMAVDVDNNFAPVYVVQRDSKKRIAELRKFVKDSTEIVLATDEDREGESISWHLLETLKPKVPVKRIAFHEITKSAIDEAIANPRDVNQQLVRAQESRRILDRLFGYSLSPVLWKKVRTKLSAGRVQSVAVRLVVEREEERRAFRTAEYWDAEAALEAEGIGFKATLTDLAGKRIATGKDFDSTTGGLLEARSADTRWLKQEDARSVVSALEAGTPWRIARVEQKEAKLRPGPPFITSTLQQAASSQLGFSPRQTMQVAQKLYEGVDLGVGEREGLITYMRTDSVILSEKALIEAGAVIKKLFGDRYHQRRQFATKSKMAQEAHEAIRPTHLDKRPEDVAQFLNIDEQRLYRLIWNRTLASQMADAELLKTSVEILANTAQGEARLRANGSVVTFAGFLKVADSGQEDALLPALKEGMQVGQGQQVNLRSLTPLQHATKPPARFNEASLVKRLEEEGIGRPSTYAPTISVIQNRGYVQKIGKALAPTYLGIAVVLLLRKHFPEYVDLKFTARMEGALDDIANGEEDWVKFLTAFYRGNGNFGRGLEAEIKEELPNIDFPNIPVGNDPNTGEPIVVRLGRTFPYLQRGEGGPENTVSMNDDVLYEDLSVEKASELLLNKARSNESLGDDPETGEPVYLLQGPYGLYVQLGEALQGEKKKPKRSSLQPGDTVENITLEKALLYLSLPRQLGKHPETDKVISTNFGRFGPYIVHDGDFRSLEKGDSPFSISYEKALAMLAQPKRTRATKQVLRTIGKRPDTEQTVELYEGKYGPYVSDGELNASLPKDANPETFTLEAALKLLAEAADRAPAKKRPVKKKATAKAPAKKAAAKKPAAKKPAARKKPS